MRHPIITIFAGMLVAAYSGSAQSHPESSQSSPANVDVNVIAIPRNTPVNKARLILIAPGTTPDTLVTDTLGHARFTNVPTPVNELSYKLPNQTALEILLGTHDNPSVQYDLPHQGHVSIDVITITGQRVRSLYNDQQTAGRHNIEWDGRNDRGINVATSIYLLRMTVDRKQYVTKMQVNNAGRLMARGIGLSASNSSQGSVRTSGTLSKTDAGSHTLKVESTSQSSVQFRDTTYSFGVRGDTVISANVILKPAKRNISGQLVDYRNNPRFGYLVFMNANHDTVWAETDVNGMFSARTNPTAGDTLKAMIDNPAENRGFIRTLYLPGKNDTSNVKADAIPALNQGVYVGLDTLASFAWEANLSPGSGGMYFEGLKKPDLNNLKEIVSSRSWTGDTIYTNEQQALKQIVESRVDSLFTNPSNKYIVPQDSVMLSAPDGAVTILKDKASGAGEISSADNEGDGIIDKAVIRFGWIIADGEGGQKLYNYAGIVQEVLSGRIAPYEVGRTSPIRTDQTVLHGATLRDFAQPSDSWLANIVQHYPPKTSFYKILVVGSLKR